MAFISFADNPLFEMTIPAKLQSYMACGMPILAVAGGETKRIVEEAECGVVCTVRNEEMVKLAIDDFMNRTERDLKRMSENALSHFEHNFRKDHLMKQIEAFMQL